MSEFWDPDARGVLRLPSGRLVRGRSLRLYTRAGRRPTKHDVVPPGPSPTFALYLLDTRPPVVMWESRWIRWKNGGLPQDWVKANVALREAWERAEAGRVEVACDGGNGRTGTALACLAVLDGMSSKDAVELVHTNFHKLAVQAPRQRWFVSRFLRDAPWPVDRG
jgi:protein-tyrosine phosphatase